MVIFLYTVLLDAYDVDLKGPPYPLLFGSIDRKQGEGIFILQNFLLFTGTNICVALCGLDRAMP